MMQRCAIYTRKSSEEGLEQAFNSLHAQREACEAYITSQHHEGWRVVRKDYDDGGYSGGSMNRPALGELLAAVERHEIDVIVVYKVDRLTRALSDFAKIVELLDSHGVSFVSVTQQFNTTSSMGRLPAHTLESAITTAIVNYLDDKGRMIDELVPTDQNVNTLRSLESGASQLKGLLLNGEHLAKRDVLQDVIERIDLTPNAISITFDRGELRKALGVKSSSDRRSIKITVPIRMQRRGIEAPLIIETTGTKTAIDPDLCKLIAQARIAFDLLADGKAANLDELSEQIGLHRNTLSRILPLAFLAAPIVEDILAGKQPSALTAKALKALSPLPACWNEQRKILAASA